jgi:hypothetical protein
MRDTKTFELGLIEQHWCEPNPEMDPSAGGTLRVVINGTTVLDGTSGDVGIHRSALALSRTLLRDHSEHDPVAPRMIFHDCGFATTLEVSCGIGANWWVRREGDNVRIEAVVRSDGPGGEPTKTFPEASCLVPAADYAHEVIALAEASLDFASGSKKRFVDEFDRSEWHGWQNEIRATLAAFAALKD